MLFRSLPELLPQLSLSRSPTECECGTLCCHARHLSGQGLHFYLLKDAEFLFDSTEYLQIGACTIGCKTSLLWTYFFLRCYLWGVTMSISFYCNIAVPRCLGFQVVYSPLPVRQSCHPYRLTRQKRFLQEAEQTSSLLLI